jgi:signal transduction histidine kinase
MTFTRAVCYALFLLVELAGHTAFSQATVPDSIYQRAYRAILANDYSSAIDLFEQYVSLPAKASDSLKRGNALIGIGIANDKKGNYDEALKNYFLALKAYETLHNDRKIAGTLKNIGSTYREFKDYPKSLEFLLQALLKMQAIKDSAGMADIYDDIGIVYLQQDSIASSIYYLEKVAGPFSKFPADDVKAYAFNNLADAYEKARRYEDALRFYQSSLALEEKLDDRFAVAIMEGNIGELYTKMGKSDQAIRHAKKGLEMATGLRSNLVLESLYSNLAEIYTAAGNYKEALAYRNKQMAFQDSLFKEQSLKNYAEMDAKYQGEKRRQQIISLQQKATIDQLEISGQQRTRYFLLGALVLVLITAGVLLRSFFVKRAANRQLFQLNGKLAAANESKTKLFGILSHDLRGPVSSLFNYLELQKTTVQSSAEIQDQEEQIMRSADQLLETMEDLLIWSKSQLESIVPFIERIDIDPLFKEMVNLLSDTAKMRQVQLTIHSEQDLTVLGDVNFLRIVIRNLVSNAIAFTPTGGQVELLARMENDKPVILVRDTGSGIPETALPFIFDWASARSDSSGLGLKLVKDFVDRLNASITVLSGSQGTEFRIAGLSY